MQPVAVIEHYARRAHVVGAWLFVACITAQMVLVGVDLFTEMSSGTLHREFAFTYGWLAPGLVLLSAAGRLPRRLHLLTGLLLVLFAVQIYLPTLAEQAPAAAALHAVNALAVFWLAVTLATQAGRHLSDSPVQRGG